MKYDVTVCIFEPSATQVEKTRHQETDGGIIHQILESQIIRILVQDVSKQIWNRRPDGRKELQTVELRRRHLSPQTKQTR